MSKLTVLRERMHSLPETPCKPFAGVSTTMPPKQRSSAPALLETRARQEPHRRRRKRSTTAPLLDPTARPFVKTPSSSSVNLGQIARADDPILIDLSMSVASEAQEPPAATWNYLVDQQYPEKTPVPSHKAIPEATEPTPALTPSTPSRTPRKLSGLSPAMRGVKSLKLVADECGCCGKKTNDKELTTINPCKVSRQSLAATCQLTPRSTFSASIASLLCSTSFARLADPQPRRVAQPAETLCKG